jgi:hypothetical protein
MCSMKNGVWGLLLMLIIAGTRANAQAFEVQQLLLNVEKLAQLKAILSDLKKGYEIVSKGYTTIKTISEGNFHLHDLFLDRLLQVSPVVKNYRRVRDVISAQLKIVREYKTALRQFGASDVLKADEMEYLKKVYANLLDQSVKHMESLALIITAGKLRMSDDERLSAIDAIWKNMEDSLTFLRQFTNETKILALQRAKEKAEVVRLGKLYSINN